MLIKIFCQKLIVQNVISAFLNHLKQNFLLANHGGQHRAPPLFKISGSTPVNCNNEKGCFMIFIIFIINRTKTSGLNEIFIGTFKVSTAQLTPVNSFPLAPCFFTNNTFHFGERAIIIFSIILTFPQIFRCFYCVCLLQLNGDVTFIENKPAYEMLIDIRYMV